MANIRDKHLKLDQAKIDHAKSLPGIRTEGILHDLLSFRFETIHTDTLLSSAWQMAQTHTITIYDAVYLALAMEQKVPLYTADRKLYDVVRDRESVRWIAETTE